MKTRPLRSLSEIAQAAEHVAMIPDGAVLSTVEASQFLMALGKPMTPETLRVLRSTKPDRLRFVKRGKSVSYIARDLRRFALGQNA